MKKIFIVLVLVFLYSCKKENNTPAPQKTYTYETITYKAYGGHDWYEITYMEKGVQKHKNSNDTTNINWTYTYSDTVGTHKQLIYQSSLENDTMTAIIKINGITTDSVTLYGSNTININR